MFATYLIGLREGLEATLVVSILVAFLVKSDRRNRLPHVWLGVAAAVLLSVFFGWLIEYTSTSLLQTSESRELFDAITSVAAVVFVTWMIFWMRKAARSIARELRGKLSDALAVGAFAVTGMAFLAVIREGLETALIFYSAAQSTAGGAGRNAMLALIGGILTAVVLGFLLYRSALKLNLSTFFTWTGALLILVAAGIFKYGVHDFQEAGVLPGLNNHAFDISSVLDPSTWYAALLSGMFNITATPSVLEMVAWVAYAVPVLVLFLRKPAAPAKPAPAPTTDAAPAATPAEPAKPAEPAATETTAGTPQRA
ncbi:MULTISPECIES: iron uptake transporter permease EfeU [Micromonospora]|uniref:Iron transporter n=1 Tax=Micromonospora solifontis TaxID=2487138 RepID=A0ABX9WJH7_9ACTN|nr:MULTISPECIES: iron uptake transporter permease EfeU [Micromonospora]NES15275.1 iron transporter [Micromonospora sp. PPF5-17B]NES36547.1 iron transporter [Micromonospora solifontis]NES56309.1 iron transporter [Micromonospora sp. PPF5-6]RNL99434.1 iron transporter [Micromonospora solifontis]